MNLASSMSTMPSSVRISCCARSCTLWAEVLAWFPDPSCLCLFLFSWWCLGCALCLGGGRGSVGRKRGSVGSKGVLCGWFLFLAENSEAEGENYTSTGVEKLWYVKSHWYQWATAFKNCHLIISIFGLSTNCQGNFNYLA